LPEAREGRSSLSTIGCAPIRSARQSNDGASLEAGAFLFTQSSLVGCISMRSSGAALLEREEIFERSPQPLFIFVRVQQDRHSIMERPYCVVAVSHRP
jgi:hypothetical protein